MMHNNKSQDRGIALELSSPGLRAHKVGRVRGILPAHSHPRRLVRTPLAAVDERALPRRVLAIARSKGVRTALRVGDASKTSP